MNAKAEEKAFVFDSRMAGSAGVPMRERPTEDEAERRLLAEAV
jgi:hypothetical protein